MVGRWRLPRQRPAPAAKKRRGVTARFPRVERWVGVDLKLASLITPFPFRSERNPTIPEGLDSRERRTGRRTVLKALDPAPNQQALFLMQTVRVTRDLWA